MPLKKSPSKAAFVSNVVSERTAGKTQKQAQTVPFGTQRKARGISRK